MAMPLTNTTHEPFLERLFDADIDTDWLNLFTVDFRNGQRSVIWRQNPAELADIADDLSHANVWFSAATRRTRTDNGRRGGNKDCRLIPALWVDIDIAGPNHPDNDRLPRNPDEAHQLLASYPMPPTVIVNTGGGIQAWWKLAEPIDLDTDGPELLDRWRATWQANADQLGWHIDNVFDPARIMRLPGTWNHKTQPPQPVTVEHADWTLTYGHDDIDQWLHDTPTATPTTPERPVPYIGPERPGDAYNVRHTGADILERAGFTLAKTDRNGDRHYTRPGKDTREGTSATVYADDGHTTIWSDTCQQMWPSIQTRRPYDPFGLYTHIEHGGDYTAASRHLQHQGYGNPPERTDPDDLLGDSITQHAAQQATQRDEQLTDALLGQLISWGEFWTKDHKAEEWIAWPLIPRGRQVALYAPAKTGKSIVTLAAVAAAATGRPIFGNPPTQPIHVLYLDYEMTDADLYERLEALGYGPEVDMTHLHYALLPSLPPLNTPAGCEAVCRLAELVNAEVVVVDTTGRAVDGEENSADTYKQFANLTGLRLKAAGRAVLRTDHAGKDKDKGQRGSSAKNDDVDVVLRLDPAEDGYTLTRTHSRVAWVPEKVAITRSEDTDGMVTFTAKRTSRMYAPGTKELAAELDRLKVPVEANRATATAAYKAAHGKGKRGKLIDDALAYRRSLEGRDIPL